jgi:hypothetical protein
MKKHIYKIIFTVLIITTNSFAQDLIVKKNGEEVNAKIIEVGTKEVKYKNSANQEGPNYVMDKSEILFVKYKNGEKEIFAKSTIEKENVSPNPTNNLSISKGYYKGDIEINKREFEQLLSTNQKAYKEYKHGKLGHILGLICVIPGGAMLGFSLGAGDLISKEDKNMLLLFGGLYTATGITLELLGKHKIKNAIKTYNKSKELTLNFEINSNGVGLAMRF